jgi:hypothetical protein
MLQLTPAAEQSLQAAIDAAGTAIGGLVAACTDLQRGTTPSVQRHLDGSIRRLNALQRDLQERSRHRSADALFVTLTVAQAALTGLAESMAETRHAVKHLIPFDEPTPGWFIDEDDTPGI